MGELFVKYSIIIPHFNDEVGLERLLKSIPKREDIQVIVVDDRSDTKEFKRVVHSSDLPNIQSLVNDRIKSAGTCRNIGLENAKGEYLLFADSDDYFTSNAFEIMEQLIAKFADFDICFFCVSSIKSDGSLSARSRANNYLIDSYILNPNKVNENKLRLARFVPWGKLIKHQVVIDNSLRFDQTLVANDGMFSLALGKAANKIIVSDKKIYCVVEREGSLTTKKDVNKFRIRLEVYIRYYNALSKKEIIQIGASPAPVLYQAFQYGVFELFRTALILKYRKIPLFKNILKKIVRIKIYR